MSVGNLAQSCNLITHGMSGGSLRDIDGLPRNVGSHQHACISLLRIGQIPVHMLHDGADRVPGELSAPAGTVYTPEGLDRMSECIHHCRFFLIKRKDHLPVSILFPRAFCCSGRFCTGEG